ncbi:phenazine biosynthesis-like domain-containing protein 1 isoform X1 [Callorhinchus milii]|uniref:phenazine biosynthesis-like domain-containing protein 1 isoform X1 n=1 Tax=Callorhinchus milii TaxID=7868 RepID=UPI001C3FD1CE|nr:phenazine biosynthesis-like domain-containing protein 1 isoform X1 [Callorhinchus milii]
MQIPIFTVDTFTSKAFCGNPAAVCLLDNPVSEEWHQNIATEMNLSETAFIRTLKLEDTFGNSSRFSLRWFTPTNEVPLCGHATLAAAKVLFQIKKNSNAVLTFETLSGELHARQAGSDIVLDFPLNRTTVQDEKEIKELIKGAVGDLNIQDIHYSSKTKKLLVRLNDAYERTVLETLQVDPNRLLQAENSGMVKGLILTLKGTPNISTRGYDLYSRYFSPWNGIPEDPVTGSAHTVLASYWTEQLGKREMLAYQCSKRGGSLKISVKEGGRVDIAGTALIVLHGSLILSES